MRFFCAIASGFAVAAGLRLHGWEGLPVALIETGVTFGLFGLYESMDKAAKIVRGK